MAYEGYDCLEVGLTEGVALVTLDHPPMNLLDMALMVDLNRLSHELESRTNMRVSVGELSPHVGLAGPGLAARQILAGRQGGGTVTVDELVIQPAWSTSWFRGSPSIHMGVTSTSGNADGVATLGGEPGWRGFLAGVDVAVLPIRALANFDLTGRLDAEVDLRTAPPEEGGGLAGIVDFALKEGSFQTPDLPIAVPFDQLSGRLDFGGDAYLQLDDVQLEGPLIQGAVGGTIGHAPAPGRQPLAIQIAYQVNDPSLAPMLGSLGRRGSDGRSVLKVSGTLAQPVVR